jgi:hypothetical protein
VLLRRLLGVAASLGAAVGAWLLLLLAVPRRRVSRPSSWEAAPASTCCWAQLFQETRRWVEAGKAGRQAGMTAHTTAQRATARHSNSVCLTCCRFWLATISLTPHTTPRHTPHRTPRYTTPRNSAARHSTAQPHIILTCCRFWLAIISSCISLIFLSCSA